MSSTAQHEAWLRKNGLYFYFPEKTVSDDIDQYTTMIIVTGLRELGYPCFSNVAHTGLATKPISQTQNDFVVLDVTQANYSSVMMDAFSGLQCRAKLIHSRSDTNNVILMPNTVTSLMTHENRFLPFKQPRQPWAFGLSNKWLQRHVNTTPFSTRRPVLVRNFRPSPSQGVRSALDLALVPHLEKYFTIDRTIEVSGYPERLTNSVGCLAYGGEFYSDLVKNPYFAKDASLQQLHANCPMQRDTVVARWDSWRFWESLAAGCLTFQLDFEEYGFLLPEMPVRWKHYVPLRLDDPKGSVQEFMDRRTEWEAIAEAGKAWALAHYTPVPTAKRFIDICLQELVSGKPKKPELAKI
jgi:hypothetical protein